MSASTDIPHRDDELLGAGRSRALHRQLHLAAAAPSAAVALDRAITACDILAVGKDLNGTKNAAAGLWAPVASVCL